MDFTVKEGDLTLKRKGIDVFNCKGRDLMDLSVKEGILL